MKLSSTYLVASTLSGYIGHASSTRLKANKALHKRRKGMYALNIRKMPDVID
jgi:hypothetical protein